MCERYFMAMSKCHGSLCIHPVKNEFFRSMTSQSKKKGGGFSGLVVGTGAGDVKVYDALMGELKKRCKNVIEG